MKPIRYCGRLIATQAVVGVRDNHTLQGAHRMKHELENFWAKENCTSHCFWVEEILIGPENEEELLRTGRARFFCIRSNLINGYPPHG